MPLPKKKPQKAGRKKGTHNRLIIVTYQEIADWARLSVRTCQEYAYRGYFDPRDLESVLQWINTRRQAAGKQMIGIPTKPEGSDDSPS